jgi:ATP-dependent DNA ligase
MSDALPNYVLDNYAKAVKISLSSWIMKNPLPAICECKYDGIRVFLFKSGDKLLMSSKHGAVYTPEANPNAFAKLPELTHAPHRVILDGEYVANEKAVHLFDVLRVDDRDLRPLVLEQRRKVLDEICVGTGLEVEIQKAKSVEEILKIKEYYVSKGYEGIIVKNPLSTYGQPNSWLKLKRYDTIDCFVIDYEETPEFKRTGIPRSWLVGVYDMGGQIVNLGKVGSFVEKVNPGAVRIGSVIEVRFQQLTDDKKLRAPFILRVRHDKTPNECSYSQLEPSEGKEES